jgi:predicted PurR-regulated permease PerM
MFPVLILAVLMIIGHVFGAIGVIATIVVAALWILIISATDAALEKSRVARLRGEKYWFLR